MFRESKEAILFLLPFFTFLSFFILYPLGFSFYLSLNDFSLATLTPEFIGIQNYASLLSDRIFLQAASQTLIYLGVHVALGVPLALGLALLLNEKFRGRAIARICLLVPWATPPIVTATMFTNIFNTSFGIINYTLVQLGVLNKPVLFFGDPSIVLFSLVMVQLWKTVPLLAFIFLSALQNLPAEIIESAKIYHAGAFRRFIHIVVPYLKPTLAVNSILAALLGLQVFDTVISITKGGPGFESFMLYFYAYQRSFPFQAMGYGAAISYVVAAVSIVFAFLMLRIWRVR